MQFATSHNRALSNTIGPRMPVSLLRDCSVYPAFAMARNVRSRKVREIHGDGFGNYERLTFPLCDAGHAMICFRSLLQGDRAGVEIATDAHTGLLRAHGLLDFESQLVADRPFRGDDLLQGLVIDDYFAIAKVPLHCKETSKAMRCLAVSKEAYRDQGLIGSDDKDVVGTRKAKIIGACIDATEQTQSRGVVLAASPAQKRYGLSWLTLQLCQLAQTSDSLHLCVLGGWTSMLMFRRPFMAILQRSFHAVDMDHYDPNHPKMLGLSRPVAGELTLLAVLCPLMVSDLASPFDERIYATDASLSKGAIVRAPISGKVMKVAWRCARSKGAYTRLMRPSETAVARALGCEPDTTAAQPVSPDRPLAYRFDFVEVFAGSARVTSYVADRGLSVCCPIELSLDAELDVSKVHVLEWLIHLVQHRLIKAFMVEPPCTTFSVMRRPPLRSKELPYGFVPSDPQTAMGNVLAHRALQVMHFGRWYGVSGLLENPWSSKMKFLPVWQAFLQRPGVDSVRTDSCAFGSPHLKFFNFVGVWADMRPLMQRCDGSHVHLKVEGKYTKASATYVPRLAAALASVVEHSVLSARILSRDAEEVATSGLEDQLLNELSTASHWQVETCWTFKGSSHINLLELSVVLRLVLRLIRRGHTVRALALVDSNVVRCAVAKGRSSSKAISKLLSRITACLIAGGIYSKICGARLGVGFMA